MIIFVVNCGSSSIKYQLLNMNGEQVLAKGLIERIGMEGSVLKHTPTGKYTVDISAEIPDHSVGIQMALDALTNEEYGVIDSMDEIDAVGHRVVHGGERFTDSVLISDDVLNGIEACAEIAPLHNPPNLYGIKACMRLMYNTPQVQLRVGQRAFAGFAAVAAAPDDVLAVRDDAADGHFALVCRLTRQRQRLMHGLRVCHPLALLRHGNAIIIPDSGRFVKPCAKIGIFWKKFCRNLSC